MEDFPDHPLPEVGHVLLCEVDWSVFGNTVSIFAGKHATVASIHLLWNFLAFLAEELPAIGVKLFSFLVNAFLLQILHEDSAGFIVYPTHRVVIGNILLSKVHNSKTPVHS